MGECSSRVKLVDRTVGFYDDEVRSADDVDLVTLSATTPCRARERDEKGFVLGSRSRENGL